MEIKEVLVHMVNLICKEWGPPMPRYYFQCFELLFVSYDDSLSHLMPELRSSVETVHRTHASLTDAIVDMRMTLLQVKSTLARANDMPHIAAVDGDRLRD